jgi:hypothetical protein
MTDKPRLESFKAGSVQKPRPDAAARRAAPPEAATETIGFERIEGLLDHEVPGEVGLKMANLLDSLSELEKTSTTPKAKAGAKKARVAVERTIDLLDYLYQTKQNLLQQAVVNKP